MAQVGVKATLSLPVHDHATDPAGGKLSYSALNYDVYESLIFFTASDYLFASNDLEKTNNNTSPELFKEIKIYLNPSYPYFNFHNSFTSIIRVRFDLDSSNPSYSGMAQVYLNDTPKGTLRANAGGYYNFSEDINFGVLNNNALIQLYAYSENASAQVKVRNFRLYLTYNVNYFKNLYIHRPYSLFSGSLNICLSQNTLT